MAEASIHLHAIESCFLIAGCASSSSHRRHRRTVVLRRTRVSRRLSQAALRSRLRCDRADRRRIQSGRIAVQPIRAAAGAPPRRKGVWCAAAGVVLLICFRRHRRGADLVDQRAVLHRDRLRLLHVPQHAANARLGNGSACARLCGVAVRVLLVSRASGGRGGIRRGISLLGYVPMLVGAGVGLAVLGQWFRRRLAAHRAESRTT